jgi:hypothetical protein
MSLVFANGSEWRSKAGNIEVRQEYFATIFNRFSSFYPVVYFVLWEWNSIASCRLTCNRRKPLLYYGFKIGTYHPQYSL